MQALLNYSAANGNLWALPNQAGIGSVGLTNNLLTNGETYLRRDQTAGKVNWNPTSKLSMFVRLGWGNNAWTTPTQFGDLGGPGMSQTNTAQGSGATNVFNGTVSGTYIISPSLIFDAHYGYDVNIAVSNAASAEFKSWRTNADEHSRIGHLESAANTKRCSRAVCRPSRSTAGMSALGSREPVPAAGLTGIRKETTTPISLGSRGITTSDSVSTPTFRIPGRASTSPPAAATSAAPAASTLPSKPRNSVHFPYQRNLQHLQSRGPSTILLPHSCWAILQDSGKIFQWPDYYYTNAKYFAGYARDQWQVTPKLTVNLGVRFDYFPIPLRNGTGAEYYDQ